MPPGATPVPGPVVVGALGGSGTRLVARVLSEVGFSIGPDLNPEQDNLWFTLLFKRRRWLEQVVARDPAQVRIGLDLLEKAMVSAAPLTAEERRFLGRAVREVALHGHDHRGHGRGLWPFVRAARLLRARPLDPQRVRGWGWKEPNSHLFLPQLAERFPGLRFIQVVRNGLDMAWSGNDTQLQLWGRRFGVEPGRDAISHARSMLELWARVHERVLEQGRRLLGPRLLMLSFDALVLRPEEQLAALLAFLEVPLGQVDLERLRRLPVRPDSLGRYRRHGLEPFPPHLVERVRELGFAVDPA